MNPLIIKGIAGLLLLVAIGAGLTELHHHIFQQGVTQEKDRRDKIDAANTIKAQAELATLNGKLRAAQAQLTAAIADLATKQTELDNEKAISSARVSDLLSGRERMRVLVIPHHDANQAGSPASAGAAAVDQGAGVIEDLDPRSAIATERLRFNENAAIDRLEGCIKAYDAVKAAADNINGIAVAR